MGSDITSYRSISGINSEREAHITHKSKEN